MRFQFLVTLLELSNPSAIEALKLQHSGYSELFSTARELGRPEQDDSTTETEADHDDKDVERRRVLYNLAVQGAKSVISESDLLATRIRNRLKIINIVKNIGSLITAGASGLTAVLTFLAFPDNFLKLASALVATAAGLATLIADQFERAPSGIRIASIDVYSKLLQARSEIEVIKSRLARNTAIPISEPDLISMLDKLDIYSVEVLRLKSA